MKYQAFYVIRPNQALLEKVSQSQMDKGNISEVFTQPCLWSKYAYDDRSWRSMHEVLKGEHKKLKILFILKLKRFYGEELSCIFGHDVLQDDSDFDRWWEFEFFDGCDEYYEEVFRELEESMKKDDWVKQEKELMFRIIRADRGEADE